jgi:nucleotide-binding universal stress UspA family protein
MTTIHRVVYATDFSAASEAAWDEARRLGKLFDAEIVVLHAVEPPPLLPVDSPTAYQELLASARRAAEAGLDRLLGSVVGSGLKLRIRQEEGPAARRILEAVAQEMADLLVIGTHARRGVDRVILGSVADRLMRQAPCPVLTVRGPRRSAPRQGIRRVCYATDLSSTARAAWPLAVAIATASGADIDLVHVTFQPVADRHMPAEAIGRMAQLLYEEARAEVEAFLAQSALPRGRVRVHLLQGGTPDEGIVHRAEEHGADLIVMGTHGWSGLPRWLLGSVAHHVIHTAPCPVLTVSPIGARGMPGDSPNPAGT